jgi:hypothetical protein
MAPDDDGAGKKEACEREETAGRRDLLPDHSASLQGREKRTAPQSRAVGMAV